MSNCIKRICAALVMVALSIMCVYAQAFTQHTVQRGENLESIAAQYHITVQAIRDANPNLSVIYVGYKLNIPTPSSTPTTEFTQGESAATAVPAMDMNLNATQNDHPEVAPRKPSGIEGFSNVHVFWRANPKGFGKGDYGIGFLTFNDNGWGGGLSVEANYGIGGKDISHGLAFHFGPAYGYAFNEYVALSAKLEGFVEAHDTGESGTDSVKTNGGITITPGLHLRADKLVLTAGFEVGWKNKSKKAVTQIQLCVGYNF